MNNYRILVQYEGTRYQGWQKQDSTDNTIQGKLEAILTKMTGEFVQVDGSGRTDAGVHAVGQVANFHLNEPVLPQEIMEYLNRYLPEDIGVIRIEEVAPRFHSRLNAVEKTYTYRVINNNIPHVFARKYAFVVEETLDVDAMREASRYLCGTHDYKAFTSAKKGKKSTVRTVKDIVIQKENDMITFTYQGDGFLYHMVRILTGTLIEVGLGKRKPEDMEGILDSKIRENAGPLVPAKGLCLMEVKYH